MTTTRQKVEDARSEPPLRGASILTRLDNAMIRLDRGVERLIPTRYNPFAQTGAIAVASFIVAAVTGILLLVWYRPSVHHAYESVMAMEEIWIGEFIRSLHRYSSDVCIFFVVIHALRLLFAGRFTGARWLAWVTGVALIGLLWFIGWTGYLLVWDEPAQLIAQGSALLLDVIPIFSEPVSRAFLAEELVPSLLFFVIFFTHMLLPLVMVVGLWIHVGRVQRPKFLPSRWMGVWTVGALVALSVILPASAQDAADLATSPEAMNIDIWYMAPLILTDRLGSGMLWTVIAVGGGLALAAPWIFRRSKTTDDGETPSKKIAATLNATRCNGCTLCARDCPYDAIVMVPREDDRNFELQAKIDPRKCVGCGVCAGACDSGGIGLDWLPVQAMRKRFDGWIDRFIEESNTDDGPVIAFLCADSAASRFEVDEESGTCEQLPGYRVVAVPCAGWVQPLTVERALRRGAAGVMIVGCDHSEPQFREGNQWTERRLAATRKPKLRREKVEAWRVQHVTFDRTRPEALIDEAARFQQELQRGEVEDRESSSPKSQGQMIAGGVVVSAAIMAMVAAGSMAPYSGPPQAEPTLVVSVNHQGQQEEECVPISEEEQANQPVHMQRTERCERGRADLTVEISVDGEVVHHEVHAPRGVNRDGRAVTLDRIDVAAGERDVRVRISDTAEDVWTLEQDWRLNFERGERQVVLFDTGEGWRRY